MSDELQFLVLDFPAVDVVPVRTHFLITVERVVNPNGESKDDILETEHAVARAVHIVHTTTRRVLRLAD